MEPKVHNRDYKSPPLVPILSVHFLIPCVSQITFVSQVHIHLVLPSYLFLSYLPAKIVRAFIISSESDACSFHLELLNLISLTYFKELYIVLHPLFQLAGPTNESCKISDVFPVGRHSNALTPALSTPKINEIKMYI